MSIGTVSKAPIGLLDNNYHVNQASFGYTAYRADYTTPTAVYKAIARPGTPDGATQWQIGLYTYDGSNNLLSITWPLNSFNTPSTDFVFSWTSRASYTYA